MNERVSGPVFLVITVACLFIIIFGIRGTSPILNPILLAVVITIAVLPLPQKLVERGMPGWLALALTILAVVGGLLLVLVLIIVGMHRLSVQLPTYSENIAERTAEMSAWFQNNVPESVSTTATPSSQQVNTIALSMGAVVASSVVQLFMTLLIFIFMIITAISLPPASRDGLKTAVPILHRVTGFTGDVRKYVNVTTVINLLVGLGDTILLLILGVDFAVLWGILSWILGYIPTVGFWLALIPPTILAWAEFGVPTALIVFVGYVLINGSVQNFVQPKMMGDSLRISPVVIFLSLFVWGWLLGGIGAILAVPLTLLILAVLESLEGTRGLTVLMRLGTKPADEAQKQKARQQLSGLWDRARGFGRLTTPTAPEQSPKSEQ
jgi:predicted PurR-regulated permease PerM